jgi:hypothetical protein
MSCYILKDGEPVPADVETFARWRQADRNAVIVALDELSPGGARVSTVFLGIDHNFSCQGPPVLFETMIFGGELDGRQVRYCARDEALAGHAEMLAKARAAES